MAQYDPSVRFTRKDIEDLLVANSEFAKLRASLLEKVKRSRTTGANLMFGNYDTVAHNCGQDTATAKIICAYQQYPDYDIPIVDMHGVPHYFTQTILADKAISVNNKKSAYSWRYTAYTNGKSEKKDYSSSPSLSEGATSLVAVDPSSKGQEAVNLASYERNTIENFHAQWNGLCAEWAIVPLIGSNGRIGPAINGMIRDVMKKIIRGTNMQDMMRGGIELMQLPPGEALMMIENLNSMGIWDEKASQLPANTIDEMARIDRSWSDDMPVHEMVCLDDIWSHSYLTTPLVDILPS